MTTEDKGFKMLKQQYAAPFQIPIREDIWEKRGMFPEQNLEENEENIDRTIINSRLPVQPSAYTNPTTGRATSYSYTRCEAKPRHL